MTEGRLIIEGPTDAVRNMAVDQALLESTANSGRPVLRFYQWDQPTISLGYFQSLAARRSHPGGSELPVVRRATGGGAIIHDRELTYSLSMPIRDRASAVVQQIYQRVHQAIRDAFFQFGVSLTPVGMVPQPAAPEPWLCFQRRAAQDLKCAGYKVVGSAQRRTANAVLQHGSILLQVSPCAVQLPGIYDLTGETLDDGLLIASVGEQIQMALHGGSPWQRSALTANEEDRVRHWSNERFADPGWLARRP